MLLSELMQLAPVKLPGLATLETEGLVTAQGGNEERVLGAVTITKDTFGVNPSGALVKTYSWRQTDKLVLLQWLIRYGTTGSGIQSMSVPFPADCPPPLVSPSQLSDAWVWPGDGGLYTAANVLGAAGATAGIFKESGGAITLRAISGASSTTPRYAVGVVSYITI